MPFEVGHVVESYRVDHVVHTGRFTVVYAATDLVLGRKTALKVLAEQYAPDPNFRERFAREVQVAASLDVHPNMVPVYGSGEADGTLFLATKFIEGVTLEELVRQQPGGEPLPPVEALEYLHEIASALDFANSRHFVHRDVKPGNVLIGLVETPPRAYLVDFGVTKDIADNAKATQHGLFLGTAEYASPEQIHGAELDARSDVYSLACTAFELLTGSSPFGSGPDDAARIAAHLQAPIPSAVERRASVPDAVDRVLARGLSKDPAGRPASAGDFVQALNEAFAESTVLFERPTARGAELPTPPAARRRRWIPVGDRRRCRRPARGDGAGRSGARRRRRCAAGDHRGADHGAADLHGAADHAAGDDRRAATPDAAAGPGGRDRPRVRRVRPAGPAGRSPRSAPTRLSSPTASPPSRSSSSSARPDRPLATCSWTRSPASTAPSRRCGTASRPSSPGAVGRWRRSGQQWDIERMATAVRRRGRRSV